MTEKIWANSGDSHFLEPETLWRDTLPPKLAELVPYTERDPDGQWETVHIDGMSFRRLLPTGKKKEFDVTVRIDTPQEILYYQHGGILLYVLRQLAGKAA